MPTARATRLVPSGPSTLPNAPVPATVKTAYVLRSSALILLSFCPATSMVAASTNANAKGALKASNFDKIRF